MVTVTPATGGLVALGGNPRERRRLRLRHDGSGNLHNREGEALMAFSQKQLAATFSYGGGGGAQGGQAGSGPYTTPNGLRMSARIVLPGGQDFGTMNLAIYGMTSSHMNALTVLPFGLTSVGNNTVTLMAGDDIGALSTVFTGTVTSAFADFHEQPEGCFRVPSKRSHVSEDCSGSGLFRRRVERRCHRDAAARHRRRIPIRKLRRERQAATGEPAR